MAQATAERVLERRGVDEPAYQIEEIQAGLVKKRYGYLFCKRIMDIVASSLALIVLSPFFLILAAIIFIDDPHGSPFYSQSRVGKDGRVFKFWKFRSMIVNADQMLEKLATQNEKDGPVFKMKNDPRITRIGHFIRKTSIDELPQLWNVLRGDMSLVGPRPALPAEVAQYNEYQRLRLSVVPGLTCYWQVQNHRDNIGFGEWVNLDVKYIKERNLWLDIKLVLLTVKVVVTGQGQ